MVLRPLATSLHGSSLGIIDHVVLHQLPVRLDYLSFVAVYECGHLGIHHLLRPDHRHRRWKAHLERRTYISGAGQHDHPHERRPTWSLDLAWSPASHQGGFRSDAGLDPGHRAVHIYLA